MSFKRWLVLLAAAFLLMPLCARAQLSATDLLTPIIKNIDGFTIWCSLPGFVFNQSESVLDPTQGDVPTLLSFPRFGFSVNYKVASWPGSKSKPLGDSTKDTTLVSIEIDSAMGVGISTKRNETVTSKPPKKSPDPNNVYVSFGYSYSSPTLIRIANFTTTFPCAGLFGGVLFSFDSGIFSIGAQMNLYSLSNASARFATSGDSTLALNLSTGLSLAADGFFRWKPLRIGTVGIFFDAGYEQCEFSGLTFTPLIPADMNEQKLFDANFAQLPKAILLRNIFIRVGLDVSTSGL